MAPNTVSRELHVAFEEIAIVWVMLWAGLTP